MKSVLFDTDIAAAWLAGERTVRDQVLKALAELGEAPVLFVSVVTIQEMMVWAHITSNFDATRDFLATFSTLEFTEDCALHAATLAASVGRPSRTKPKSLDREQVNHWQRDSAIAGTVAVRRIDMLLTRDRGFLRFQEHVDFRIVVVS
jgi:predicted nucleic acid-binding protein